MWAESCEVCVLEDTLKFGVGIFVVGESRVLVVMKILISSCLIFSDFTSHYVFLSQICTKNSINLLSSPPKVELLFINYPENHFFIAEFNESKVDSVYISINS